MEKFRGSLSSTKTTKLNPPMYTVVNYLYLSLFLYIISHFLALLFGIVDCCRNVLVGAFVSIKKICSLDKELSYICHP